MCNTNISDYSKSVILNHLNMLGHILNKNQPIDRIYFRLTLEEIYDIISNNS